MVDQTESVHGTFEDRLSSSLWNASDGELRLIKGSLEIDYLAPDELELELVIRAMRRNDRMTLPIQFVADVSGSELFIQQIQEAPKNDMDIAVMRHTGRGQEARFWQERAKTIRRKKPLGPEDLAAYRLVAPIGALNAQVAMLLADPGRMAIFVDKIVEIIRDRLQLAPKDYQHPPQREPDDVLQGSDNTAGKSV